ncbi:Fpg/Nei family DNA glycosylase [Streptomyces sp. NPDC058953]|uniref:Fpg/Nei family DNA glycosylase n=1 Tax=unclassified Streptomyces TaxID=2593676 RepID=UPI003685D3A9
MPEGDTVWLTAHRLHHALAGGVLTRFDLRVPRFATADLTGRSVLDVTPRGKHLLTRFEGGLTLHSHLRMDGAWRVFAAGDRWTGGPAHQIRAVLGTEAATAVGYRLPVLELLRTRDEDRVVGHLGPDLLGPDWDATTAATAVARLRADPARPVGDALLDQRNLAGIGNVYRCELVFLARVTPWLPIGDLPEETVARLVATAHRLLMSNRTTFERRTVPGTGRRGPLLYVYGRAGHPCARCGRPIRVTPSHDQGPAPAPDERIAYWCPGCQQGPGPPRGPAAA